MDQDGTYPNCECGLTKYHCSKHCWVSQSGPPIVQGTCPLHRWGSRMRKRACGFLALVHSHTHQNATDTVAVLAQDWLWRIIDQARVAAWRRVAPCSVDQKKRPATLVATRFPRRGLPDPWQLEHAIERRTTPGAANTALVLAVVQGLCDIVGVTTTTSTPSPLLARTPITTKSKNARSANRSRATMR